MGFIGRKNSKNAVSGVVKELEEWFKKERAMFDSDEEYLSWYNEECRKIAKENDLELEPRIYKLK